jgi:hypothetical protein
MFEWSEVGHDLGEELVEVTVSIGVERGHPIGSRQVVECFDHKPLRRCAVVGQRPQDIAKIAIDGDVATLMVERNCVGGRVCLDEPAVRLRFEARERVGITEPKSIPGLSANRSAV